MGQWFRVASRQACRPGTAQEYVVAERVVALFNVNGEIYALDGICPHQGGPLGKGRLQGEIVTCPWHGWQFNVRTGQHEVSAALCHPRLDTKVEGDDVYVFVDDAGVQPEPS
jgi:nitrite reductase (NADH) small subunit